MEDPIDTMIIPYDLAMFNPFWGSLCSELSFFDNVSIEQVVSEFVGEPQDTSALEVEKVHHIARYIGEYSDDRQVDMFFQCLHYYSDADIIQCLERGPTYISPKHYGTPGWWFSFDYNNTHVELFTCKHFGPWMQIQQEARTTLMSHYGLQAKNEADVYPIMESLVNLEGEYEIIAYSERDVMGHTYGHVRNNKLNRVIEIVYSSSEASGKG